MFLFAMLLVSWVIGGLIINVLTRILLKTRLNSIMYVANENDYTKGYMTGVTNLKMYYYSTGEIPDMAWLQKVERKVLDTRTKLDENLNG
jgi:hypothetical protein